MLDPELLELMPFTCTLRPAQTTNGYGESTHGAPVTPHCHMQYTGKQIYSDGKVVRTEEGEVTLDGPYDVDTSWSLAIPTPGGERAVEIISVEQSIDEDGFHHTVVHFGAL